MVERDEAFENLLIRQIVRPAVGVEDRRIEVIVNLLEDRDQPLLTGFLFQ